MDITCEFRVTSLHNNRSYQSYSGFLAERTVDGVGGLVRKKRGILALALPVLLLLPLSVHPVTVSAVATPAAGVIVPLYSYPGSGWNPVILEKHAYPAVSVVAVVNPANGPGASVDPNYATWIGKLKAAGITVIGYIYTSYGARSVSSVETDASRYKSMYGVSGVFLDQMTNVPGHESYYSSITSYTHSLGLWLVVGNAGLSVPSSYMGTVDKTIIYENTAIPSLSTLNQATKGHPSSGFAVVSYGVSSFSSSSVALLANYASLVYVTQLGLPLPYSAVPSYYSTLVADLNAITSTMTTRSETIGGGSLAGMMTSVKAPDGTTIKSGFTSLSFVGVPGVAYTVTADDYAQYLFAHWEDGVTSPSKTVTMSSVYTITSYYSDSPALVVTSKTLTGGTLNGMWTQVKSTGGTVISSGFTQFSFAGSSGTKYVVCVSNFQSHVFKHWEDGTTNSCRTISLSQTVYPTATFS